MSPNDSFFTDPTGAPSSSGPAPFPAAPGGSEIHLIGPGSWRVKATNNVRSWRETAARVRHVEGPRGKALRWSLGLRYISYFAAVAICTGLVNLAFANTRWSYGGTIMLFSAAGMLLTAVLGTMFVADRRSEILEELRKALFQMLLFPSTGIALAHWFLRKFTSDPGVQNDFLSLLDNYLPMFFLMPALLSLIVYVKGISGIRFLNRSRSDAEEMMNTWTRQDHYQR